MFCFVFGRFRKSLQKFSAPIVFLFDKVMLTQFVDLWPLSVTVERISNWDSTDHMVFQPERLIVWPSAERVC